MQCTTNVSPLRSLITPNCATHALGTDEIRENNDRVVLHFDLKQRRERERERIYYNRKAEKNKRVCATTSNKRAIESLSEYKGQFPRYLNRCGFGVVVSSLGASILISSSVREV